MHEQDFDEVAERGRYTVSTLRKGDKHKGEVLRSGETKPAWTSDLSYETEFEAAGMARCYVGALVDKARRIHDLKVARSEALAGRLTINYEKIAELDGEKRKVSSAIKRLEILNRDLIREADSPSVEVRFSETIGTYTLVVREEGEEVEESRQQNLPLPEITEVVRRGRGAR